MKVLGSLINRERLMHCYTREERIGSLYIGSNSYVEALVHESGKITLKIVLFNVPQTVNLNFALSFAYYKLIFLDSLFA